MNDPIVTVPINTIVLRVGECLTVWMESSSFNGCPRRQVELRVLPNGKAEVFAKSEDIQNGLYRTFDEWHSEQVALGVVR